MSQYQVKGLCTLLSFEEYLQELRHLCGNPFEAEDAHTYLCDTHKQGSMSFAKYYHLFSQKKECSWMNNASLIDCLKRNVNYATQLTAFSWQGSDGKWPSIFYEYVQAFTETDKELQQLKHQQPHPSVHNAASLWSKSFTTSPSNPMGLKPAPVTSVAPSTPAMRGEPMDLSSAMAAVQGKPLATPEVRDICNKWNLCYYCKLQHLGKTAKECLNRKPSSLRIVDLENDASINSDVSLSAGKV